MQRIEYLNYLANLYMIVMSNQGESMEFEEVKELLVAHNEQLREAIESEKAYKARAEADAIRDILIMVRE